MIYHIFEHFQYLDFPGSGIMQYISVRSILASITAIVHCDSPDSLLRKEVHKIHAAQAARGGDT